MNLRVIKTFHNDRSIRIIKRSTWTETVPPVAPSPDGLMLMNDNDGAIIIDVSRSKQSRIFKNTVSLPEVEVVHIYTEYQDLGKRCTRVQEQGRL